MGNRDKRVFVAGHGGMVGSAIVRKLKELGYCNIITRDRSELDLTNQMEVADFFKSQAVEQVYLCAAKVGGIYANNTYPADFIYENLMIEANLINASYRSGVNELLFLGSSCIYPKEAAQPIREEALLSGPLEPTNEPYAVSKIAGIKLCESYNRQCGTDFRSVMPTNLYGPGDNFDPNNSHVIPGLLRRFHEAKCAESKEVVVWGSGRAMREFLHVDDLAAGANYLMERDRATYECYTSPMLSHINIGTGRDCSIQELAEIIAQVVGFEGDINFDTSMPDGSPRKLLDVARMHSVGWRASIGLKEGLHHVYQWFLDNRDNIRG